MLREGASGGGERRPSVLVVDDDQGVSDQLARAMAEAGYEVRRAFDGATALQAIERRAPDLVLLDVGLPDLDGLEVLRRLRRVAAPSIGVIVISGRAAEHQRLAGFAAGADDYVVKPFSSGEVVARASAILRRLARHPRSARPAPLADGSILIDQAAQQVSVGGRTVRLTGIEYRLLVELLAHARVVRTRAQLIQAAWGAELRADANTVTVHIQRLRRKLREVGATPDPIRTVHGLGYRFDGEAAEDGGVPAGESKPAGGVAGTFAPEGMADVVDEVVEREPVGSARGPAS